MGLLDDAKIQIRAIKERPTGVVGDSVIGVHWQTLDTLVKIAELALRLRRTVENTGLEDCDCDNCVNDPILERIEALKATLGAEED